MLFLESMTSAFCVVQLHMLWDVWIVETTADTFLKNMKQKVMLHTL